MKHFWSYLLVSIALHVSVGLLLRDLRAQPDPLAWQPPMAIQLVSLAAASAPAPAPAPPPAPTPLPGAKAVPAEPVAKASVPTPPKVPVLPKPAVELPKPLPAKVAPAVAKTPPPRPPAKSQAEPRPAQPTQSQATTAQTSTKPAPVSTSSPAAPVAAAPARPQIPVVSLRPSFVTPPPAPRYPSTARRRNQQGTVRVEVCLDDRGQQLELKLTQSSGVQSLDDAALEAVKSWRFRPEIVDGRAVPSRVEIPIEFALTANR